ncbi:unnamed protein product [Protopolystoma xenopodis]|uniref:Uncharacterized protein n=1 Tax=Protopolystoma xenopodis TaxID=117903 RepID=A0A3S5BEE9_9PLAT|nr:unnamed protein product [Protopolystoma xenopodis]
MMADANNFTLYRVGYILPDLACLIHNATGRRLCCCSTRAESYHFCFYSSFVCFFRLAVDNPFAHATAIKITLPNFRLLPCTSSTLSSVRDRHQLTVLCRVSLSAFTTFTASLLCRCSFAESGRSVDAIN